MDAEVKPLPEESELTERQRYWLAHLRACEAAGVTAVAYAKEHELSLVSLYQRRREFRKRGLLPAPSHKAPSFAKVRVGSESQREANLQIRFPNGVCVEWPMPRDEEAASRLLRSVAHLS